MESRKRAVRAAADSFPGPDLRPLRGLSGARAICVADPAQQYRQIAQAALPMSACVKLGREKGYRMVGANRYGFNALFLRDGVGEDVFPAVSPERCLRHPYAGHVQREWLPAIREYPWVEV